MSDITISTGDNKEQPKIQEQDIKDALTTAKEISRIEAENDRLRKAIFEQEELKAKLAIGGRAQAGQVFKSPEEIQKEQDIAEAKRLLSMIG